MGNCLVTKLKGTVDNDNLPILGQTVFDLDYTNNVDTTDWSVFRTNDKGPVSLSIVNGTIQASIGSNPILANSEWVGWIRREENKDVKFTLSNSIYNLYWVRLNAVKEAKGLGSLLYSLKGFEFLLAKTKNFITDVLTELAKHNHFTHVALIPATWDLMTPDLDPLALLAAQSNINTIKCWSTQYLGICSWFSNSNLQYYRGKGNLEDLPVSLRQLDAIDVEGYRMTGNISTLVAKFIAAGRTSGTVFFLCWSNAFPDITITVNGEVVTLATYMASIGLSGNDGVYISWNAQGNITLTQGSAPADYVQPDPVSA